MAITDSLLDQLRMVESGGNPRAVSPAGAQGPYQFMPGTAKQFGIDPFDERQSREAARKYLTQLYQQFGSMEDALRAYNWGPGNMDSYRRTGLGVKGQPMPQETQDYVGKVLNGDEKMPDRGRQLADELFGGQQAPRGADRGRELADELFGAQPEQSPSGPAGGVRGVVGGVLRGLRDPIDAGAQLVTRGLEAIAPAGSGMERLMRSERERVENINRGAEQDYRQNWRAGQDIGFDAARLGGNVLATLPLAGAGSATAPMAARVAQGAAAGGGFGALQPVTEGDFWTEKGKQVASGAAMGGLAAPIAAGAARMLSPRSSAEVQALRQAGITPTPGQVLGGVAKATEEKLTSIPILGDAIKAGQRRAIRELNETAVNRALFPIGAKLPKGVIGREAIEYADDAIGKVYERALDKIGASPVDDKLLSDFGNLRALIQNQPKELASRLDRILDNEVLGRTEFGRLTGEAVKKAESQLGKEARRLMSSSDADQRVLGEAVSEAQRSLRQWMQRVAPPGVAADIRRANTAWANFKRVQRASSSLGAQDGVFSGAQLQNAVKALDGTSKFSKGRALMQDLSEPAKNVLSQNVPDSGTPGRLLAALAAGGGLGFMSPGALVAGSAPALLYTPAGQRAMASLLSGRQTGSWKAAAEGMLTLTPALGAALAPAGYGLLSQ